MAAPNATDLRVAGLEGGEASDATINLTALNETDCNLLPPHSCNQEMPSAPTPLVMNKGQSVVIKNAKLDSAKNSARIPVFKTSFHPIFND